MRLPGCVDLGWWLTGAHLATLTPSLLNKDPDKKNKIKELVDGDKNRCITQLLLSWQYRLNSFWRGLEPALFNMRAAPNLFGERPHLQPLDYHNPATYSDS